MTSEKNSIKRILHIVPSLSVVGGKQHFLMNYYRFIDRSKIQFDFLPILPKSKNNEKSFSNEIINLGGKVIEMPELKLRNIFKIRKFLLELYKEENYRIVHCHCANFAFLCLYSAKKSWVPHRIIHSHQNAATDVFAKKIRNTMLIHIGKKYANINCACSDLAGKWLFKNHDFTVINNAIETDNFLYDNEKRKLLRKTLNIIDKFAIGTVGRFTLQKNPFFAMDVFKEFIKLNKDSVYLWAGSGDLEDEVKEYAKTLNIEDNVIFLGAIEYISDIYQAMDLFFLPSLYEGLGIVNIEAQMAGLPVICSDSVPKEAKISENIYFLSLSDSKETWAKEMFKHISKVDSRKNMYEKIKGSSFDIKTEVKKMEKFYEEMV